MQECQGFTSGSGFWHKLLALPAARLLRAVAPHSAAWLLRVCALQHAEYTLVKVSVPVGSLQLSYVVLQQKLPGLCARHFCIALLQLTVVTDRDLCCSCLMAGNICSRCIVVHGAEVYMAKQGGELWSQHYADACNLTFTHPFDVVWGTY